MNAPPIDMELEENTQCSNTENQVEISLEMQCQEEAQQIPKENKMVSPSDNSTGNLNDTTSQYEDDQSFPIDFIDSKKSFGKRMFSFVHRLLSIPVVISVIILCALIVSLTVLLTYDLVSSKKIFLELGEEDRNTLAQNVQQSIEQLFTVSTQSMNLSIQIMERNLNYTRNVFTDTNELNGLTNLFRSYIAADSDALEDLIIYNDGSSIMYANFMPIGYVLYVSSSLTNYTAIVNLFNSSDATEPFDTVTIPDWNAKAPNDSFWKQAMAFHGSPDDYIVSRVFSITVGPTNVFCLSKKLYYANNEQYAVYSTVFNVNKIEQRLQQVVNTTTYILVTDEDGSFITTTLDYNPIYHTTDPRGDYIPISATNNTELILLNEAIQSNYGGWNNIQNITHLSYNSPMYGKVIISKITLSFPNRNWYVFVAWVSTEWTKQIQVTIWINIGVAIAVLLLSAAISFFLSIPIIRSINRIKECFKQVREMNLDAPIIKRTLNAKYFSYESVALQSSFKAMIVTLRSFQKYVPGYVVYRLVHRGMEASLGLKPKNCSILFLDIKDFTKYCEELDSAILVSMISEIFEKISLLIQEKPSEGIIDKYIGDCIMAYWYGNAHELRACQCAIDCKEAMKEIASIFVQRGLPAVECRIGLNSGLIRMGNFGSKSRFNWTIIGDEVDLASRLESLNKQYGTVILTTENTLEKIEKNKNDAFMFVARKVEKLRIKNREKSIMLYELIKKKQDLTKEDLRNLNIYENAFDLYCQAKFIEAINEFKTIPDCQSDPLVRKKIEQCFEFIRIKLDNWDGILSLDNI
jgi:class 3 adenylate cyclase/HAMP domain-containing protein